MVSRIEQQIEVRWRMFEKYEVLAYAKTHTHTHTQGEEGTKIELTLRSVTNELKFVSLVRA